MVKAHYTDLLKGARRARGGGRSRLQSHLSVGAPGMLVRRAAPKPERPAGDQRYREDANGTHR